MPPALWIELFHGRPARRVAAGVFVYLKGDAARSAYVVRTGLIKTSIVGAMGGSSYFA